MIILVVGSGSLGTRHVQGCLRASEVSKVYVVDKDNQSLSNMQRIVNSDYLCDTERLNVATDYAEIPDTFDLCIISTSANGRANLLSELLEKIQVKFWILEKLLEQSLDGLVQIETSMQGQKCWVNTPRRIKKLYNKLPIMDAAQAFHAQAVGNTWGLASNAIHYIDYFEYLSNRRAIKVITNSLNRHWYPTKRIGYSDIAGELKIFFENSGILTLSSKSSHQGLNLSVKTESYFANINELSGEYCVGEQSGVIDIELQSSMTPQLISNLQKNATCELPDLNTSLRQHQLLISALLSSSELINNYKIKLEAT